MQRLRLSAGISGALVPHAPLLLPEVAGTMVAGEGEEVRTAARSLEIGEPDVVVVLSPHARTFCVYESVAGSLGDFGVSGIELQRPTDPGLVTGLAEAWERPVERATVDYGVIVALMLLETGDLPVVAAGLSDLIDGTDSYEEVIAAGADFGRALKQLAVDRSIFLVAGAHTASALTPRSPLTERPAAKAAEYGTLQLLDGDPSGIEAWLQELARTGGSCSPGTLAAYAAVFAGRRSEVLAYQHPFGVGYVVARAA